ncbi:MAG: glycosyltransferase [Notoacmeibacter sp.]|nr:glycosyltransferase [Notoacmeibacter sp.]
MHLVFVTSIVPDGSPSTGYEIANAAIINALRRTGVRVTVLGYCWPGKQASDPENTVVLGEVDVTTGNAGALQKVQWLGAAMAGGYTFASAKLRVVGEAGLREALSSIGPFDGFILNAVQMAGAYPALFMQKPFAYVAHNVEYVSALQNAEAASSAFQRYLFKREARLLRSLEEEFCRAACHVFTLSGEDQRVLSAVAGHGRFSVLPLITREVMPQSAAPVERACDAALIGTWTWAPNRIGLDWFLQEVTPFLPEDFSVHIAGSVPADLHCDHPGVKFVGRVPDATEFVRSAGVVPLASKAGTGVQLKTIETFELGLPCVATASALRGVAHKPDNCMVADDPREFAAAMVKLAAAGHVVDGQTFHAAQRRELDHVLVEGLESLRCACHVGEAA